VCPRGRYECSWGQSEEKLIICPKFHQSGDTVKSLKIKLRTYRTWTAPPGDRNSPDRAWTPGPAQEGEDLRTTVTVSRPGARAGFRQVPGRVARTSVLALRVQWRTAASTQMYSFGHDAHFIACVVNRAIQ